MDQRDDRGVADRAAVAAKRRLAEVFGDALPPYAEEDRPEADERRSDEEYLRDRPPHHLPHD